MNEQIKKLYDEAWAETTDHYGTMQKFAELIVRECIDIAYREGDNVAYLALHFGVEE